jgi:hypothetical protein
VSLGPLHLPKTAKAGKIVDTDYIEKVIFNVEYGKLRAIGPRQRDTVMEPLLALFGGSAHDENSFTSSTMFLLSRGLPYLIAMHGRTAVPNSTRPVS